MREYTDISGKTRLVAFFAQPAKHSLSPKMHNLAFSMLDIDAVYLAFEVAPEHLAQQIHAMRVMDILGANVSMPHKQAVIQYLDELSSAASLVGAVNTIVQKKGRLIGHNTDGQGFMRAIKEMNINIIGQTITIIGAGGAAMAMIAQAALDGVKKINVFNRQSQHYSQYQKKLAKMAAQTKCQIELFPLENQQSLKEKLAESCLLVNASSVGMAPNDQVSPIPNGDFFRKDLAVYDAIYNPRETLLLKQAKAKGAKTENGLSMLLYQGAYAFELWTGREMPVNEIKEVLFNS